MWVESTSGKKHLVLTVMLKVVVQKQGKEPSETGQEAVIGFRFYSSILIKNRQVFYCTILFSGLCSNLAGRLRCPEQQLWYASFFSEKQDMCMGERDEFNSQTGAQSHSSRAGFRTHLEPGSIIGDAAMIWKP